MGYSRGVYRVLVGKPEGKRPLGRLEVDGRIILRWIFRKWDVEGMEWIDLAQNMDRWRVLVNAVMNLRGSIKCGEFLDWLRNGQLLKKDCAAWSE
jgi:hypothetical protein